MSIYIDKCRNVVLVEESWPNAVAVCTRGNNRALFDVLRDTRLPYQDRVGVAMSRIIEYPRVINSLLKKLVTRFDNPRYCIGNNNPYLPFITAITSDNITHATVDELLRVGNLGHSLGPTGIWLCLYHVLVYHKPALYPWQKLLNVVYAFSYGAVDSYDQADCIELIITAMTEST